MKRSRLLNFLPLAAGLACARSVSSPQYDLGPNAPAPSLAATVPAAVNSAPQLSTAAYRCELSAPAELGSGRVGGSVEVPVRVTNQSTETWPNVTPEHTAGVNLSYHYLDADGKWGAEGDRFTLPKALRPGESVEVKIKVKFVDPSGMRMVQIEPVYEGIAWFSWKEGCSSKSRLEVVK